MPESPLEGLEPALLWRHFDAIRRIPRPSRHEDEIADFVRSWAAGHDFTVQSDAAGNLVVRVPASLGHENAPIVVLQAHLDMVCEKNAGVEHDFHRDPIAVEVDGDWVRARGTTLGADNGVGVAAAMAAAVDPELVHGPLELLFTLDEETGLTGAMALDGAIVEGRLLINLDTEEDGSVYIGCAGTGGVTASLPLERRPREPMADDGEPAKRFEIAVRGLRGGHSGVDIHQRHGNAVKIMARLLQALAERGLELPLCELRGGSARNAIAREAFAELAAVPDGLEAALVEIAAEIRADHPTEAGLEVSCRAAPASSGRDPLDALSRQRLVGALAAVHHGVLATSNEIPGLVETSNNLARVETGASRATIECCCRSSWNPDRAQTRRALAAVFELAGAEVEEQPGYPGWDPSPDSRLVRLAVAAHRELFGREPAVKAIHAGLECGILSEKLPGLEAVSLGPEIRGAHSPDERVSLASTERCYRWLGQLLEALCTAAH